MAKQISPKQLNKKKRLLKPVIRHFAMKCPPSARVDNFSIRKAHQGLLIKGALHA